MSFMTVDDDESNADKEDPNDTASVGTINSDLTDRFKYKVQALMGTYDPPQGETDNENADGNILQAMLTFPTNYSFNVVGRTNGDASSYVDKVKEVVGSSTGSEIIECIVTPRGEKFTKISAEVVVESAAIITSIYEELGNLEETVMKF